VAVRPDDTRHGVFLPLTAVLFYLAVSVSFVIDPLRHMRLRRARPPSGN